MNATPLIIEVALNEQADREVNPAIPYAPEEIAADALVAARAGASIIHFHARDPDTGDMLHPGIEPYREAMRMIRAEAPDLVFYPTYGFSPTPQERFCHLEALASDPEVRLDFATIDPGAVAYGHYDEDAGGWVGDFILSVSHTETQHFFELCRRHGILHSITVREPGQVRHAAQYHAQGWTPAPMLLKLTFRDASSFGLPPSAEAIAVMTSPMVTGGVPVEWMTYVEGPSHQKMNALAVASGGHVRTGLGDNPLLDGKRMTNAEQVERVVELADRMDRPLATPADVRALLSP